MENENPSFEEPEEEIALYHRRIADAKVHPAFKADASFREAAANPEHIVRELEDAVAAKHAEQLLHEMEKDKVIGEAISAYTNLREALINEVLTAENRAEFLKMAIKIRAVERLHDEYLPENWTAIAHLLPEIE